MLQPLDPPGCAGRRNCNVNLDNRRWDRPDLDCEPQQARGIPSQSSSGRDIWDSGCGALVNGGQDGRHAANGGGMQRKNGEGRMWLWWWAGALVAFYGAGMAGNTSKVEARRRAREALARINEARAQRERANVDDAATFMVAVGKVTEVDAWESERL